MKVTPSTGPFMDLTGRLSVLSRECGGNDAVGICWLAQYRGQYRARYRAVTEGIYFFKHRSTNSIGWCSWMPVAS